MKRTGKKRGFALIEILIAISILSIVLLSIYTGVSASINVLLGSKNYTRAMIIAKTKLNEFIIRRKRGPDIKDEPVEDFPEYKYSRITKRFEHDILGPIPAKRTEIIVTWLEKKRKKNYSLSLIYAVK